MTKGTSSEATCRVVAHQIVGVMGNVVLLIQNMHVATVGLADSAEDGKGALVRREMGTERKSQGGQNPRGDMVAVCHRMGHAPWGDGHYSSVTHLDGMRMQV